MKLYELLAKLNDKQFELNSEVVIVVATKHDYLPTAVDRVERDSSGREVVIYGEE
jgi:hypothetical protein